MDRARIAQKLLEEAISEERASEVIGDFLETHSQSALTPFNPEFIRLLASFAWRPITALLAAVLLGVVSNFVLFVKASRQLWTNSTVHDGTLLFHAMRYVRISAPLWAIAAFALVCFGFRDRLWRVSTLYACVSSAVVYSYWSPQVKPVLWVVLSAVVVISLKTEAMRRASLLVALVLTLSLITNSVQEALVTEGLLHYRTSLMTGISLGLFLFSVPLVQAASCIFLHRRVIVTNGTRSD